MSKQALWVSQKTCKRVLGIGKRAYLDLVRAYEAIGGYVVHLGHLRLTEPGELMEWRLDAEHHERVSGVDEPPPIPSAPPVVDAEDAPERSP